ncbi:hypothetical protein NKH77_40855 [Streptomyces sp. M19]
MGAYARWRPATAERASPRSRPCRRACRCAVPRADASSRSRRPPTRALRRALTLPVLRDGTPIRIRHRTWEDAWVPVRCPPVAAATTGHSRNSAAPAGGGARARGALPGGPDDTAPEPPEPGRHRPAPEREGWRSRARVPAGDDPYGAGRHHRRLPVPAVAGFRRRHADPDRAPLPFGVDLRGDGVIARVDPGPTPPACATWSACGSTGSTSRHSGSSSRSPVTPGTRGRGPTRWACRCS